MPAIPAACSESTSRARVRRGSTTGITAGSIRTSSPPRSGSNAGARARSTAHQTTSRPRPSEPAASSLASGRAPCLTSSTLTKGFERRTGGFACGKVRTPRPSAAGRGLIMACLTGQTPGAVHNRCRRLGAGGNLGRGQPAAWTRGRARDALAVAGPAPLRRRAPPERLQIVVLALTGKEHVHDHAGVVEHDPGALLVAGHVKGSGALVPAGSEDGVGDGANLAVGVSFADHEVIGERGPLPHVEADDAPRFLVRRRFRDQPYQLQGGHPASIIPRALRRAGAAECTPRRLPAPGPPPVPRAAAGREARARRPQASRSRSAWCGPGRSRALPTAPVRVGTRRPG